MKKIYNLILVAVALFALQPVVKAQPYVENNHIAYSKTVSGPVDGIYTIHLDTFVTGEVTVSTQSIPADIVLVLDVSGSMNDSYSTYTYTARGSQGYSYNGYGNNTYYYLHTDGNYYPVTRGQSWVWAVFNSHWEYYLQVSLPNGTYYLSGTSLAATRPTTVRDAGTTIWTGVLYTRQTVSSTSRLDALKTAVSDFVDVVKRNNDYEADGVTPRQTPLGNQIAVVKFASNSYYDGETSLAEGNHRGANNNNSYNYTEVLKGFTNVSTAENVTALKTAVNGLEAGGATAADYGMRKAELLLNDLNTRLPNRQSNKTVVLFTDGDPTHGSNFSNDVANATISKAYTIKHIKAYTDDGADVYTTVYTVGVFTNPNANETTYMNYTSSNYPNATNMTTPGTGGNAQGGYFQNAANGDLSDIFRSIAAASGGSGSTVATSAVTTVDIVSQSFQMPQGATGAVHVYFANCTGKDANGYLTFDEANKSENPAEGEPGHVTLVVDDATQKITATGFDYSGNWCGYDGSINDYHGMKLMIEIPIEMKPEAVGGTGVGTNAEGSGIFVDGVNICPFESPHINLPTNLHIQKAGLAAGECATFEIYRRPLKKQSDGTYVIDETQPWATTPYKTVMVIGGQRDNTVKLMGLDPTYQYKIKEAGWGWSYDFVKVTDSLGDNISSIREATSDQLILNPFIFVNTKKATQVRHAESAVYNDFSTSGAVTGVDAVGKNSVPTTGSSSGDE